MALEVARCGMGGRWACRTADLVANLLNLIVGFAASKRGDRPHWFTNWLSVTSVLSGAYLSAHFVLTAFFLNLGLHC